MQKSLSGELSQPGEVPACTILAAARQDLAQLRDQVGIQTNTGVSIDLEPSSVLALLMLTSSRFWSTDVLQVK